MEKRDHFLLRIAVFNALGLCLTAGGVTLVDARLTSHVVYGPRHYPMGLWVCWPAPVVFALTWLAGQRSTSRVFRIAYPSAVLALIGTALLPDFRPEVPHNGFTFGLNRTS